MFNSGKAPSGISFIVLGAGKGSRLSPYTEIQPKWLLPVGRQPILHSLIAMAHHIGITRVMLIRGDPPYDPALPCIQIVESPDTLNMVGTLFKAESSFGEDFIMSYGDILYEPRVLKSLCESDAEIGIVIDQDWQEYYKFRNPNPVQIAESLTMQNGSIIEIGSLLRSESNLPDGQYIGLARFRGRGVAALRETYHNLIEEYAGKPWRHASSFERAFMTDLIQELIDRGYDVRSIPINRGWVEFDTKTDYEKVIALDREGKLDRFLDLAAIPSLPTVLSAGGVVLRQGREGAEVRIVSQGPNKEWRLPKGMQEPGEEITTTAAREVSEEAGLRCIPHELIAAPSWTYEYGGRRWEEICHFFNMECIETEENISDPDINDAAWIPTSSALEMLRYPVERNILNSAVAANSHWNR